MRRGGRVKLQKIARPVTERAVTGDGDNVLSLSGEHGLVLQSDYFGKRLLAIVHERYLKLLRDDFVYNDRTHKGLDLRHNHNGFPNIRGGIVSPIYIFRFNSDEESRSWKWYF